MQRTYLGVNNADCVTVNKPSSGLAQRSSVSETGVDFLTGGVRKNVY